MCSTERRFFIFDLENPLAEGEKLLDRVIKNLEELPYLTDVKISVIKISEIIENCSEQEKQELRGSEFHFLLDPSFGIAIKQRSGNMMWLTFTFEHNLDHIKSIAEYHYS